MAFVQSGTANLGDLTATTATATFGSNLTAGNLIVVAFTWDNSGGTTITSVVAGSDTLSQLGTTINDVGNGQAFACFYKEGITGGGNTVVVTWGSTQAFRRIAAVEHSGLATTAALVDHNQRAAFSATTGTDNATVGTVTPTATSQLIVSAICVVNQIETYSAGTGYTKRVQAPGTGTQAEVSFEDSTAASTSAQSATWTLNTATTSGAEAYVGVFALPGGGAPIVSPPLLSSAQSYAAHRAASI